MLQCMDVNIGEVIADGDDIYMVRESTLPLALKRWRDQAGSASRAQPETMTALLNAKASCPVHRLYGEDPIASLCFESRASFGPYRRSGR